ncbi:hypothetical protein PAECIP111890_00664 [Paenibacillus sp. JJ-223]|nr:hypothetical protein PAECIP111890_00664 [Paenibacillus sp. JJ-223]
MLLRYKNVFPLKSLASFELKMAGFLDAKDTGLVLLFTNLDIYAYILLVEWIITLKEFQFCAQ